MYALDHMSDADFLENSQRNLAFLSSRLLSLCLGGGRAGITCGCTATRDPWVNRAIRFLLQHMHIYVAAQALKLYCGPLTLRI